MARGEDIIQIDICRYLARSLPIGAVYHSVPNGMHLAGDAAKRAGKMRLLKDTGLRAGASDLTVLWNGRRIDFEVKSDKGRLSPEQTQFACDLCAAGGHSFVVRSVKEVQEALESFQMPLRNRLIFPPIAAAA